MLKRIITATVLILILLSIFFYDPSSNHLHWFMALVVALASWEWSGFCYNVFTWRISYVFFVTSIYFLLLAPLISTVIIILASIIWIFNIIRILNHGSRKHSILKTLTLGFILICGFALAIIDLRFLSIEILLLMLISIWTADSLGLIIGKKFGKNKLIPIVSPNKTWEGLFGALAGVTIIVIGASYFWQIPLSKLFGVVILTTLMSVIGDLYISCYKRQVGINDTGKIFPGHGGLLDRIDGLLAAAPIYWSLIYLTNLHLSPWAA